MADMPDGKGSAFGKAYGWFVRNWPAALILIAIGAVIENRATQPGAQGATPAVRPLYPETVDESALRPFQVVNAHEHLMSRKYLPKYFAACEQTGVTQTLFVASSDYTIKGKGADQREGNDENTAELNAAAREHPGRIVPFCTIHPDDPDKLEKIKAARSAGAKGLKLYTGHSNFYNRPLDDAGMVPVYAYCEETALPICWHVNTARYMAEFERVLQRFPRLVVIVPHFGVTFFHPRSDAFKHFERLMDTYPNLYTDTSFGTRQILVSGLEAVSRDPEPFRAFMRKYSDRVLFGTDMVITGNKEKTAEWIADVIRACRSVLEKPSFRFAMGASMSPYAPTGSTNVNGHYWGLNLDDDTLRKIYETNVLKLFPEIQATP